MGRCSRCQEVKPLAEFPPSKVWNSAQWCRRCLRESKRETLGLAASEHQVVCRWCGRSFESSYAKAEFCSRRCKDEARNRARQEAINAAKPDRRCVWCGVEMPRTMRSDARFCSAGCNSHAHHQTRNYRRRLGKDAPVKPRKDPLVSFIEIAERDGWRCGICGGAVSRSKVWPNPLAASLDHIVRVSEKGTNDPENLRLAHYRCNSSRR